MLSWRWYLVLSYCAVLSNAYIGPRLNRPWPHGRATPASQYRISRPIHISSLEWLVTLMLIDSCFLSHAPIMQNDNFTHVSIYFTLITTFDKRIIPLVIIFWVSISSILLSLFLWLFTVSLFVPTLQPDHVLLSLFCLKSWITVVLFFVISSPVHSQNEWKYAFIVFRTCQCDGVVDRLIYAVKLYKWKAVSSLLLRRQTTLNSRAPAK